MGCADERETHHGSRSYDVSRKIHQVGALPLFIGASGNVANYKEIVELVTGRVKGEIDYRDALEMTRSAYKQVRDVSFKEGFLDKYNVSWDDFKAGRIDPKLFSEIKDALDKPSGFSVWMIFGGYDVSSDQFRIHAVTYPGNTALFERMISIGSGSDMADISIGNALASIQPDDRGKIERYAGARILMESTQAAWKNFGVGGRTQLVWTEGNKFYELGDKQSSLLNAALYAERKGLLKREYVNTLFQHIIHDRTEAKDLISDLMKNLSAEELAKLFWLDSLHI